VIGRFGIQQAGNYFLVDMAGEHVLLTLLALLLYIAGL